MKTIIYECGLPNTLSGGFGDRLIGIISCLALCEYTGAKLKISWNDTPLYDFFEYSNYAYNSHEVVGGIVKSYCNHYMLDLKMHFHEKSPKLICDMFACDHLRFNTNQNLWQYLSINEPYEDYTSRLFKALFTSILVPKPHLSNIVNEFTINGCIGIQLRFGDVIMNTERRQINNPQYDHFPLGNNFNIVEKMLHEVIEKNQNEKIFITSDINITQYINLSKYPNVIMYDKPSVHIERSIDKQGLDKCFVDFLVLCECKTLYITAESNFGRCPGIISGSPVFKINSSVEISRCTIEEMACKHT